MREGAGLNVGLHEIKKARMKLKFEWEQQTFEAFILPLGELHLLPTEEKDYVIGIEEI